jgi:hypothetical protein
MRVTGSSVILAVPRLAMVCRSAVYSDSDKLMKAGTFLGIFGSDEEPPCALQKVC